MKIENGELYMSKEKFMEIMDSYRKRPAFICMDSSDLEDIFNMVYDLLKAEEEAMRKEIPYATVAIREYNQSATTICTSTSDFCDAFESVYGE